MAPERPDQINSERICAGQVVALLANFCWVRLDRPGPDGCERLLCTRRTRLDKSGQQVAVGDHVELGGVDWTSGRAAIERVRPRRNLLERPAVANVERIVVVVALQQPAVDPLQLTRFLLTAEATGCRVELVVAKADLTEAALQHHWCDRLRQWGYDPLPVSSVTGAGLEALRARLRTPGITVFCGPSGVGKSSLLNALRPDLDLRVAAVSGRLQRGRHTTRHVELFPLTEGVLLADTPGFNRPVLPAQPEALAQLFPEIRRRLAEQPCRFRNCRHQQDPGCSLGSDWDRYTLYGQCLAEVEATAAAVPIKVSDRQRGDGEALRLAAPLRQLSRRRQRQQACQDLEQD
ncbi:ribosome small subunit-dependent GTPase A [Synechococcus sp. CCY9202]|uniref:ribosome small subunit-dependent GTPase A n=1 Tax=Synechococcus sp. CCY9202 TaxID=174698 RepID=UPI002B1F1159|nr:ribosome small subunit-dependent GTPase A [Synechococcus sp. CCY9202]MEA5423482.1 ribosome small subunit-dependent GTPase A [Synechococcus sp. CCY9202]